MEMEKPICKFFLQGHCKFGKDCHNSHVLSQKPNTNLSSFNSNICKFFVENKCTKDKCTFFHGFGDQLQHVETIKANENEINNLIKMYENQFVSSDEHSFAIRFTNSPGEIKETVNKEGYKIGKMVLGTNELIFGLRQDG